MESPEAQFCENRGKRITLFNPMWIIQTLKGRPRLTIQNINNLFTVTKECVIGRSDSWLVRVNFQKNPIEKTIPLKKRRPSEDMLKLMAKSYQDSANDDLALAKEFEGLESEIDDECDQ
jgi:hypothetical protein